MSTDFLRSTTSPISQTSGWVKRHAIRCHGSGSLVARPPAPSVEDITLWRTLRAESCP